VASALGFCLPSPFWSPFLLVPLLYIGPLYSSFLNLRLPWQNRWRWHLDVIPIFTTWVGARNFLIVSYFCASQTSRSRLHPQAPFTEEITFRLGIVTVMRLARASKSSIVFGSPLWFGVGEWFSSPRETVLRQGSPSTSRLGNVQAVRPDETRAHSCPPNMR
jgi:prenyl protein peptidase